MKKVIISIFLIVISIATLSYAHSGRTDSYGGHYNRSEGTYHYHSGKYAHSGDYTAPIEEGGHLIEDDDTLRVVEDSPADNVDTSLYNNVSFLQEKIKVVEDKVEKQNDIIDEKNEEIQKLKDDKTDLWIIFGFVFMLGLYVSYQIGKNKE